MARAEYRDWPPSRSAGLSFPGCDRRVGEPDRQAAALPQDRVVGRRVRNPVTLLRDVMAPTGVGFERHGPTPKLEGDMPRIILLKPLRRRSMQHSHVQPDREGSVANFGVARRDGFRARE